MPFLAALLLAGLVGITLEGAAPPSVVVFEAVLAGDTSGALEEQRRPHSLVLEPLSATGAPPRVVPMSIPGRAVVELPRNSLWRVRVESASYWTPTLDIATPAPDTLEIPVHRAGRLEGRFVVASGTELPPWVSIRFAPSKSTAAPGTKSSPTKPLATPALRRSLHRVGCPVDPQGRWSCRLPANRLDIQIKTPGFASTFRWNQQVPAEQSTHVGDIALRPGASLIGFVESDRADVDLSRVEVELAPATVHRADHADRLAHLGETTRPDSRGFFQFHDLTAGHYLVSIRGIGIAPMEFRPVEILSGLEADLGPPIQLVPPAEVRVEISPPTSNYGAAWELQMLPDDTRLTVLEGAADPDGIWATDEASAGRYRLRIGGPDQEKWHSMELEIAGGRQVIDVAIPRVAVTGEVTCNGEPLRARLTFAHPEGERSILLYTDSEGHFEGFLPEEGTWSVSLLLERDGAQQEMGSVEVLTGPDGVARIDLEVPDTTLSGIVRTSSGEPADQVTIRSWNPSRSVLGSSTQSDSRGRFLFRGLPEGRTYLTAFRGLESGVAEVTLTPDEVPAEVEIDLVGTRPWRGRVVSRDGAVAGAEILVRAELPVPRQIPYGRAVSGPLGEFEMEIPADAEWLHMAVLAVGHAARLLRWAPESQPEILLDELGGTLALRLGGASPFSARLLHGDASLEVFPLRQWSRIHLAPPIEETDLVVPAMEPGTYSLCPGPEEDDCDQVFLAPEGFGVLEITEEGT